jgi:hypothetical protein
MKSKSKSNYRFNEFKSKPQDKVQNVEASNLKNLSEAKFIEAQYGRGENTNLKKEAAFYPMSIRQLDLIPAGVTNSEAFTQFNNYIHPIYNTAVQRKIGFNYTLTVSNLRNYFNDISLCFLLYYSCQSIIDYVENSGNNNEAMNFIYEKYFNGDSGFITRDKLKQLKARLSQIAIPPVMLQVIKFICQNNIRFENKSSIIRKFVPRGWFFGSNSSLDSQFEACFALLTIDNNQTVSSYLSKMMPHWNNDVDTKDMYKHGTVDKLWSDLFRNHITVVKNGAGTIFHYPERSDGGKSLPYVAESKSIPNVIFALFTWWRSNTRYEPGMVQVDESTIPNLGSSNTHYGNDTDILTYKFEKDFRTSHLINADYIYGVRAINELNPADGWTEIFSGINGDMRLVDLNGTRQLENLSSAMNEMFGIDELLNK